MHRKHLFTFLLILLVLPLEWYGQRMMAVWFPSVTFLGYLVYWAIGLATLASLVTAMWYPVKQSRPRKRAALTASLSMIYLAKVFLLAGLLVADAYTLSTQALPGETVPVQQAAFFAPLLLLVGLVPVGALAYGVVYGAHDFKVTRKRIHLPHLPKSWDGLRIAQISDIHAGSFFHKGGIRKGILKLLQTRPDIIVFTGDLVNHTAEEFEPYLKLFARVKAPLGVYSILGNHDYGVYHKWQNQTEKSANLERLKDMHREMGWKLLLNENVMLEKGGETIAIAGVENWGASSRMPKRGKLDQALAGTEEATVRILLSHDPSHWQAKVVGQHPEVDLTLSGHTHGMQFGLHTRKVKWSPVQYHQKHWTGLYRKGSQYLYVNRGFGFHGFPGRVGMPPEITVLELHR